MHKDTHWTPQTSALFLLFLNLFLSVGLMVRVILQTTSPCIADSVPTRHPRAHLLTACVNVLIEEEQRPPHPTPRSLTAPGILHQPRAAAAHPHHSRHPGSTEKHSGKRTSSARCARHRVKPFPLECSQRPHVVGTTMTSFTEKGTEETQGRASTGTLLTRHGARV